jgi:Flp pilus assembly protein TadG
MEVKMMRSARKAISRRRGNRPGGAILEMALTLALLLNLTFGMVEFGYYFYVKNSFANAAREGARAGIVPGATNSSVTTAVTNSLTACKFPASSYTTAIADSTGNNNVALDTVGSTITITVSATWSTIGAGYRPLNLISSSKTVSAPVTMAHE